MTIASQLTGSTTPTMCDVSCSRGRFIAGRRTRATSTRFVVTCVVQWRIKYVSTSDVITSVIYSVSFDHIVSILDLVWLSVCVCVCV